MKKVKTILKWLFWPITFGCVTVGTSLFNACIFVKWHEFDYYLIMDGIKLVAVTLSVELALIMAFAWAIGRAYFSEEVPDDEERE